MSPCGRQGGQGPADKQVPPGLHPGGASEQAPTLAQNPASGCAHPQACPAVCPAPLPPRPLGPHPGDLRLCSKCLSAGSPRLSPGVPEPGPRLCSLSSVSGCFSPHLSPSRALPPPSPSPCPQLSPAPSPSPVFLSPQSSLRCVLSRRLCRSLPLRIFLRPCPARPRAPPALPQCRAAGRGALRPRVNRWTLLER